MVLKKYLSEDWIFYKKDSFERKRVTIPHDAMLGEKRSPEAKGKGATAYFEGGVYCYEKKLFVPKEWQDKIVTLEFEGVYKNATIFINGKNAAFRPYGYSNFYVNLNKYVEFGIENEVLVEADNSDMPNSRWYSGSGIYRPVVLYVQNKDCILLDGVRIITEQINPAIITVDVLHGNGTIEIEIWKDGKQIPAETVNREIKDNRKDKVRRSIIQLKIPEADLWSCENPELYECHISLCRNEMVCDERKETFGIRRISWDSKGFYVNGESTLLRGGCLHHDNGILGAVDCVEANERRIRIMKEYGFNAIRSAHNPISKSMLCACDKLGMYVIDEAFDMWYMHKNAYDYALDYYEWYESDIKAMVRKDQNHPSVIMYSIGNEIVEPYEKKGVLQARKICKLVHGLDESRPVTAGVNLIMLSMAAKGIGIYQEPEKLENKKTDKGEKTPKTSGSTFFNNLMSSMGSILSEMSRLNKVDKHTSPFFDALDISGYNYGAGRYSIEGKKHPERLLYGSETMPQHIAANWEKVKKYPYVVGDFMWTAWDYLGEVGIGGWTTEYTQGLEKPYPWIVADSGALDLLGNPSGEAALAKTVWGFSDQPMIYVRPMNSEGKKYYKAPWRGTNSIPSWSWAGCEGQKTVVEVYSDAYKVELYLDRKLIGKKRVKEYHADFVTCYKSGELIALAKDASGKIVGKSRLFSAGSDLNVVLQPEKSVVNAYEIIFINLNIADRKGIIESNKDEQLQISVEGGELLAFGSAIQQTEESYQTGTFSTWHGRAQVIVRASHAGTICVKAVGTSGKSAVAVIEVK